MRFTNYFILLIIGHTLVVAQPRGRLQQLSVRVANINAVLPIMGGTDSQQTEGYVLRSPDSLFFCDENFNILKSRKTFQGQIIPSRGNRFYYVTELINKPDKDDPDGIKRLTVIGSDGTEYYSEDRVQCYECWGKTITRVSDADGRMYRLNPRKAALTILDKTGSVLEEVSLSADNEPYSGRAELKIAADGETIAILINKVIGSAPRAAKVTPQGKQLRPAKTAVAGSVMLFILDKSGIILNASSVPGDRLTGFSISDDGTYLIATIASQVSRIKKTYVYDRDGAQLFNISESMHSISFHNNLILLGTKGSIIALHIQTGVEQWKIDTDGGLVSAFASARNGNQIRLGAYVRNRVAPSDNVRRGEYRMVVFDQNGTKHREIPLGKISPTDVTFGSQRFIASRGISVSAGVPQRFINE